MSQLLWLVLTLTFISGLSAHPDDLNSVLNDIVKRLDEKDARIKQLEKKVTAQEDNEARIKQLEKKVTAQEENESRIRQLENNDKEQSAIIGELSKTIHQYKHTVESQQERISTLEEEVTIQKIRIEELQAKETSDIDISDTSETNTTDHPIKGTRLQYNNKLTKRSRRQRRDNETPVAFLACLSNHAESLGQNQNIAFDNVITNIGDAYNSHMGGFIAPVSGIYVFSTTIMSYRYTQSHFAFFKNGNLVTRMFYHGDATQAYDTTSNTITLQLAKGDDVSVVNLDSDKDVHGSHYSTFTGFLLEEIYDGTTVVGR